MSDLKMGSISLMDKGENVSAVSVYTTEEEITAFNEDMGTSALLALLQSIDALSLSVATRYSATAENKTVNVNPPTDDAAYNGAKLIVFYADTVTGDKYQLTIPARNPAMYNTYPRSVEVIMLNAAGGGTDEIATFITRFEATAVSKLGNPVDIYKIEVGSRKQASGG